VNGVKLADIMFSVLCVCVCVFVCRLSATLSSANGQCWRWRVHCQPVITARRPLQWRTEAPVWYSSGGSNPGCGRPSRQTWLRPTHIRRPGYIRLPDTGLPSTSRQLQPRQLHYTHMSL